LELKLASLLDRVWKNWIETRQPGGILGTHVMNDGLRQVSGGEYQLASLRYRARFGASKIVFASAE